MPGFFSVLDLPYYYDSLRFLRFTSICYSRGAEPQPGYVRGTHVFQDRLNGEGLFAAACRGQYSLHVRQRQRQGRRRQPPFVDPHSEPVQAGTSKGFRREGGEIALPLWFWRVRLVVGRWIDFTLFDTTMAS